jgi:hypothetical protein
VEDTTLSHSFKVSFYLGVSNLPKRLQPRKQQFSGGYKPYKASFYLGVSTSLERLQPLKQQFSGGHNLAPFI